MAGNNTTFNRSINGIISKGYHSRTLFSFTTCEPAKVQNINEEGWLYTEDFDGINSLLGVYSSYCHGSHTLPHYYWKPGKTIRVKGSCVVNNGEPESNVYLNMSFGIQENNGGGVTILASQDNTNRHIYAADYNNKTLVEFECNIKCTYVNPEYITPLVLQAQGYYNYSRSSLVSDENISTRYIPIWNSSDNGYVAIGSNYYNYSTNIIFNFYTGGGVAVEDIYITNITIEELA